MQLVKYELNPDSTSKCQVEGCKGESALAFVDWVLRAENKECLQGHLDFHVLQNGFQVECIAVEYHDSTLESDVLHRLCDMVVLNAKGDCGYGRADFTIEICTGIQYRLWHSGT